MNLAATAVVTAITVLTTLSGHRLCAAETLADRANQAFLGQQWQSAADLYRQIVDTEERNPTARARLAVALLHLGDAQAALGWLAQAAQLGASPAAVAFRRGCAYAVLGDRPAAIRELRAAVAAGLPNALDTEPLLTSLRGSPELAAVVLEQDRQLRPCRHDPRYRAFDFWIGEWNVRPNGAPPEAPASENTLTLEYEGCVIQEHWTAASGGTGSSFNIFDATRDRWYQTWVDSSGGLHEYSGNPDEHGNMVFRGELPPSPGGTGRIATRMTFFKQSADQVRQLGERTTDGGKTWTTNFDLIYTRVRPN